MAATTEMIATNQHNQLYEDIADGARAHGQESEPDMEIGDLQEALIRAIRYVPPTLLPRLRNELADIIAWKEQA